MTDDWRREIPFAQGGPEHLVEVERRFLSEAWFEQRPAETPSSALIPFDELPGRDVLEIGCGTGVQTRLLAAVGATVTADDVSRLRPS